MAAPLRGTPHDEEAGGSWFNRGRYVPVAFAIAAATVALCCLSQPRMAIAAASNGRVADEVKIADGVGGLGAVLANGDVFGSAVTGLGDLDGDGIADAAVGAPGDDDGGANRGAVWILFLNADGTVKSKQKISHSQGGFAGPLDDSDRFGTAVARLPDLDGDTLPELAVGAPRDDDGVTDAGAVWLLYLQSDGTVKSSKKLSATAGNFGGLLDESDGFGSAVAPVADLDGNGVFDLAVGTPFDDDGGGGSTIFSNRGAVWILFMQADGTALGEQKISDLEGNFIGDVEFFDYFGISVVSPGDLDGDGTADLAVGASNDDDGGLDRGAVWLLFLESDGTVREHAKISSTEGGLGSELDNVDGFGISVTAPGDLDEDGIVDLVAGAPLDDDRGTQHGAVWALFLNQDGSVRAYQKISDGRGGFDGDLSNYDEFGSAVATLTDLDGDDIGELLIGAPQDATGGASRGAVWVARLDGAPLQLCTSEPLPGCREARLARVVIRNKEGERRDLFKFRWHSGDTTPFAAFGTPDVDTRYGLCLWDELASVPELRISLVVPEGPLWVTKGGRSYLYRDRTHAADGVRKLKLDTGSGDMAKIRLVARGAEVPTPVPATPTSFFAVDTALTVQLVNTENECWTGEFTTTTHNDHVRFDAWYR